MLENHFSACGKQIRVQLFLLEANKLFLCLFRSVLLFPSFHFLRITKLAVIQQKLKIVLTSKINTGVANNQIVSLLQKRTRLVYEQTSKRINSLITANSRTSCFTSKNVKGRYSDNAGARSLFAGHYQSMTNDLDAKNRRK